MEKEVRERGKKNEASTSINILLLLNLLAKLFYFSGEFTILQ